MTRTVDEYKDFLNKYNKESFRWAILDDELTTVCLSLAEEVGEVLSLIKKSSCEEKILDLNKLKLELGDVIACITIIGNYHGISLDSIIVSNWNKLEKRADK